MDRERCYINDPRKVEIDKSLSKLKPLGLPTSATRLILSLSLSFFHPLSLLLLATLYPN